jgi:hypothetical protein
VGAHHHDRPGRLRHDVADGPEPVELRHLEIHRHDVGIELVDLAHRVEAVARRGDHPELEGSAQHVTQHAPHEGAVVHHEHARRPLR